MSHISPTLDILISTIGSRISGIPSMLLPERSGVRYIVSVQHEGPADSVAIPLELSSRQDVSIGLIPGRGLSRNRNNAIRMSTAQICLIADDDNRYLPEHIDTILDVWSSNPDADIITFQAQDYQGEPLHPYPAPYVCSQEITFRRQSIMARNLFFDERFGLGSPLLCAGEEDVFISDARKAGLTVRYIPRVIVQTDKQTTGTRFLTDSKVQITKGAAFRRIYGVPSAIWRTFKEGAWYLIHKGANPFPIIRHMLKGIWILR